MLYRVPSAGPQRAVVLLSLGLLLAAIFLLLVSLCVIVVFGRLPSVAIAIGLVLCVSHSLLSWRHAIAWEDYQALLRGRLS